MRKTLVAALCTTLAVAIALPAFALDSKLNGFVRIKGVMGLTTMQKNDTPDKLVTQRLRAKYTGTVNEYLSFVYFGEVDFEWGDDGGNGGRGNGGGFDGDAVNLETKNVYMTVKIPDTPVTVTAGLQGYNDNNDSIIFGNDAAGINIEPKGVLGGNWSFAWFKAKEGDDNVNSSPGKAKIEDDINFYAVQYALKPMGKLKLGADFYYAQVQNPITIGANANGGDREDVYYLSVNAGYDFGMLKLNGWGVYNFGKGKDLQYKSGTVWKKQDQDYSGFVAKVAADVGGKDWGATLTGIYWSADDDSGDDKYEGFRTPGFQGYCGEGTFCRGGMAAWLPFGREGTQLIFTEGATATNAVTYTGLGSQAAVDGYGLTALIAKASWSPAALPNVYLKGLVAYAMTVKDDRIKGDNKSDHEGKSIGTEVTGVVGYRMAKNLDLSLTGAYCFLGDYYDGKATDVKDGTKGEDPDNPYYTYILATLAF